MSVASAVRSGQVAAESLMTLTLAAYSPDPDNPVVVNDQEQPGFTPEGSTPGKVTGVSQQSSDTYTRTVTIGDVEVPVLQGGLHIPLSSPVPEDRWEYVVTAVGPADDPALLGRRYRVVSVPAKSFATARRLDVAEVPTNADS